jgi:hypothetical protein
MAMTHLNQLSRLAPLCTDDCAGCRPQTVRFVLSVLAMHAGHAHGKTWPSHELIAQTTGGSKRQIARAIRVLVGLGYIEIVAKPSQGRATVYRLLPGQWPLLSAEEKRTVDSGVYRDQLELEPTVDIGFKRSVEGVGASVDAPGSSVDIGDVDGGRLDVHPTNRTNGTTTTTRAVTVEEASCGGGAKAIRVLRSVEERWPPSQPGTFQAALAAGTERSRVERLLDEGRAAEELAGTIVRELDASINAPPVAFASALTRIEHPTDNHVSQGPRGTATVPRNESSVVQRLNLHAAPTSEGGLEKAENLKRLREIKARTAK